MLPNTEPIKPSLKKFPLKIEIQGDNKEHPIEMWSYIYRGNKCYSGEREENKKSFMLRPGETKTVILENTVEAEPGEYKLKIKIRIDYLKLILILQLAYLATKK